MQTDVVKSRFAKSLLVASAILIGVLADQSDAETPTFPPEIAGMPSLTPLGSGRYPAIMVVDPGLPTHTVYRPADLVALNSEKLPVVAWGNGSCINAGNRFRWFLTEIASHGFLVIAIGPIGPASIENRPALAPPADAPKPSPEVTAAMTQHVTHPQQMIDALNWAIQENQRPASAYYHRLDTTKFAVMGQSCGGEQALEASAEPRVTTTVLWNSGLKPDPSATAGGKVLTKDDLKQVHAPIAYISGDAKDIAFKNANDDFDLLTKVPVFRGYENGIAHSGTYGELNGGAFAKVGVAWLQWQLKGDKIAAKMFVGKDCGLCTNPDWNVRKKNIE